VSFTIKNLDETKDSAPQFGLGELGELGEAHFPREELGCQAVGFAYHRLRPGRRQAFGHRHENAEEVYVVLEADGELLHDFWTD